MQRRELLKTLVGGASFLAVGSGLAEDAESCPEISWGSVTMKGLRPRHQAFRFAYSDYWHQFDEMVFRKVDDLAKQGYVPREDGVITVFWNGYTDLKVEKTDPHSAVFRPGTHWLGRLVQVPNTTLWHSFLEPVDGQKKTMNLLFLPAMNVLTHASVMQDLVLSRGWPRYSDPVMDPQDGSDQVSFLFPVKRA